MTSAWASLLSGLILLVAGGCGASSHRIDDEDPADADADADADSGNDSGGDADADADADTDADGDPDRPVPISVAVGWTHACALDEAGEVHCWGNNELGQLGNDTTVDSPTPVKVVDSDGTVLTDVTAISAGSMQTCALREGGTAWCWGDLSGAEAGTPYATLLDGPGATPLPAIVELSVGDGAASAVMADGSVWQWRGSEDPAPVTHADGSAFSGVTGLDAWVETCAVDPAGGQVWCWVDHPDTVEMIDGTLLRNATDVAASDAFACAVRSSGTVWCWGANSSGQVGDGTRTDRRYPVQVMLSMDPLGGVRKVDAGITHACALKENGDVYCWGSGYFGDGELQERTTPVRVSTKSGAPLGDVSSITTGPQDSCALTGSGQIFCWGWDYTTTTEITLP